METNYTQNINEIVLLELLRKMWNGFTKVLGSVIIFLIKKSLWLGLFVVIGIAISVIAHKTAPRTYTSTMTVRTNVLDNAFMISYVQELGQIEDTLVRAKTLHIPDTSAKYIASIDAFYGIDSDGDGATDYIDFKRQFKFNPKEGEPRKVSKIFYVQVTVVDESVFSFIGKGLTQALNTNHYIVEHNTIRLQQLRARLDEVNRQLIMLDSVQRTDYFKNPKEAKASSGQLLMMNEKDRQLYHNEILNLYGSKQGLEEALAEYNQAPITVIRDFSSTSVADNPITKYLKFWVPLFFVLGLVFITLRHYWKRIWTLIVQK